jgi:hypothetical protein
MDIIDREHDSGPVASHRIIIHQNSDHTTFLESQRQFATMNIDRLFYITSRPAVLKNVC